jgi:hypothetical protein
MSRRANGEGTLRLRTDGRWDGTLRLSGRRFWVTGKTQAEARSKLNQLKRDHHVGELVEPRRLTLAQFLDQWLAAGAGDWKPKTLHGYKIICEHYWKAELGSIQLQKLTPAMLASCYSKWRADRSGGTVLLT